MSIYAIAMLRDTNGELGIRLLSSDKLNVLDVSLRDIEYYINKDEGVKNLAYNKKKEIQWKMGSVERYPAVDKLNKRVINENALIVLGSATNGINKYYRVSNYYGQIATIKEQELVEYARSHTLANCKLVKKNGTEFIQGIDKPIEEIDTSIKYKIDYDLEYMYITIPLLLSDTLVIPETINGTPVFGISSINIQPAITAQNIKKLVLSKYIKNIKVGLFASLPNLEEVEILGENVDIYDDAFITLKKLRKVHIKSVHATGLGICAGLKNLEEFVVDKPMTWIQSNSFSGCHNLDISKTLVEGVTYVYTKAFYGVYKHKKLTLPSTLNYVVANAFGENRSLEEVDMQTDCLEINITSRQFRGLFASDNPIKLYINKNCVVDTKKIGANVEIIRREANASDIFAERKVMKSSMLGVNIDNTKVIDTCSELSDVIISLDQTELTKAITELIDGSLRNNFYASSKIYTISGFKVKLAVYKPGSPKNTKSIRCIGKYVVVTGKSISFYPVDRILLKYYFSKHYSNNIGIRPAVYSSKYLKSVDVANDGTIRLIYNNPNDGMAVKTVYCTDFKITND